MKEDCENCGDIETVRSRESFDGNFIEFHCDACGQEWAEII